MTLAERALAALDDAFADEVKAHFAGAVHQVDGDRNVKTDMEHFRVGLCDAKAAYEQAAAIIVEVLGQPDK